ncbi:MAG: aldo/keto reductase [Drouetiella hepatica Uher 2000/2452]|uniref:Aldo/keto reductase n=1 Tax=Drouetiella hepatica Uher 2000/2452 TaxID=904376 RepID=A0A951UM30_9CYAN|nr:aldo/keto reductase [Drouetiella hepatica Uher 2000/2452]
MSLPESSKLKFTPDLTICRILNGMWQVSGGHGAIDPPKAITSMFAYFDAGYTTWDLADHYGPAENFIGEFRRQLEAAQGEAALSQIQAFTKWVPRSGRMTRQIVEHNVGISLRRMNVKCLDLMQFHWWDYQDTNYLDALKHLADLQNLGKIKHLALTNFDTKHLEIILDNNIQIVSNQVQYSLVDRRPQVQMVQLCQEHGIQLLTYGSLCGGLFSEHYLGQLEPGRWDLATVSLRKYKQMVDAWGGWKLFQQLLEVLDTIARKHGVSIANVAVRSVLDQPMVAGAIVGARLGLSEHLQDNARVFDLKLDQDDYLQIESVVSRSRDLYQLIGDCGEEYRR